MPNHSQITLPIHASKQYLVLLLLALLSSMHGNTMFMGFSPPNGVTTHVTAAHLYGVAGLGEPHYFKHCGN